MAKRLDHLIGYPSLEIRIEPPARRLLPVPAEDADIYFSRVHDRLKGIDEEKKQGELFPENWRSSGALDAT